jgi:hypothetical protein
LASDQIPFNWISLEAKLVSTKGVGGITSERGPEYRCKWGHSSNTSTIFSSTKCTSFYNNIIISVSFL